MPREIADSDAESDFDSPVKSPAAAQNVMENISSSKASFSGYDFDQFLDPTQRLSSLSPTQRASDMRLRSTISLSDGLPEAVTATAVRSKKRPHSTLHEASTDMGGSSGLKETGSKKTKVYGNPSRSRTVHDIDLFTVTGETTTGLPNTNSAVSDRNPSDSTATNLVGNTNMTNASLSTDLTLPSGILSLIGQSTTDESHRLTTSVASIGQYECLNLDFRGSGQGVDINTNPFGSLSQVSLDEDPNPAQTERFASMFRPSDDRLHMDYPDGSHATADGALHDHSLPGISQVDVYHNMPIDPSYIMQHDGATFDPLTDSNGSGPEMTINLPHMASRPELTMAEPEKPQPKRRGRRPKNSRIPSESPAPAGVEDVDMDELALSNLPPSTRTRRGTLDSLSQASQASGPTALSKRKRAGKPKEILDEEQHEPQPAESSPTKQPPNELNLSDEAMIGLPREQYKPRPSRSRSKRVVDEDDALPPPPIPDPRQDTPAEEAAADVTECKEQTTAITQAKTSAKKPGRKSKVKRAKTSAAALLKRGDPMLSEGEEDVVWMDTKPSPVKLDLPPDLKVLKKESNEPKDEKEEAKENEHADMPATKEAESKITIEIPLAVEVKDPVVEPKKRGRKPKKPQQREESQPVLEDSQNNSNDRQALLQKSTNVPSTGLDEFGPKRPTVVPIPVCDLQPPTASPEKENHPDAAGAVITTPSKPAVDKGPTKHSPINALNLSSGRKAIYRVGLSRRQNIPSLLRKVQRDKPPPKVVLRKEPKSKKDVNLDLDGDGDGEGGSGLPAGELRGEDGMLIEWGD